MTMMAQQHTWRQTSVLQQQNGKDTEGQGARTALGQRPFHQVPTPLPPLPAVAQTTSLAQSQKIALRASAQAAPKNYPTLLPPKLQWAKIKQWHNNPLVTFHLQLCRDRRPHAPTPAMLSHGHKKTLEKNTQYESDLPCRKPLASLWASR